MTDEPNETDTALPTEGDLAPETLARHLRAGGRVSVLDVRDRPEFEAWRVTGRRVDARHVPHVQFIAANARGEPTAPLPADLAEPVVVVCGRGEASDQVADWLAAAGVDAVNLAGGMDAWARTLLATPLVEDQGLTVLQYQRVASGCLGYLVVADGPTGREAVVVDPLRAFAERYVADASDREARLRAAVDTHVHADHVSGVYEVGAAATEAGAEPVEAVLPAGARDRGLATDADPRLLEDGETLAVGDASLEAMHAPGHTSEHLCLRLRRADAPDVLFSGDALFLGSVGRPDLEAGAEGARALAERAYETLHERLLALPDETLVGPGHYADPADARGEAYAAPLSALRGLEVLELDREAFLERVGENLPPRPANHERIVAANLGTEPLADEAAFEAELGPNNCAVSPE